MFEIAWGQAISSGGDCHVPEMVTLKIIRYTRYILETFLIIKDNKY